jgi:hypothetical protein
MRNVADSLFLSTSALCGYVDDNESLERLAEEHIWAPLRIMLEHVDLNNRLAHSLADALDWMWLISDSTVTSIILSAANGDGVVDAAAFTMTVIWLAIAFRCRGHRPGARLAPVHDADRGPDRHLMLEVIDGGACSSPARSACQTSGWRGCSKPSPPATLMAKSAMPTGASSCSCSTAPTRTASNSPDSPARWRAEIHAYHINDRRRLIGRLGIKWTTLPTRRIRGRQPRSAASSRMLW